MPISEIGIESIVIEPETGSTSLNRDKARVDFPAPVRPTIPIFSSGFIDRFMFFKAGSNSDRYEIVRFESSIDPF
jgi:hypothetical protein